LGKSKTKYKGVVYSTNPNFNYFEEPKDKDNIPFNKQKLYVMTDKKNRAGKTVVLIEGFVGSEKEANLLSDQLKRHCGVGGGYKNNRIYIQGNKRDSIVLILKKMGANVKIKGG